MPPPRPCLSPACPVYAEPGKSRCAEHARQESRAARQEGRRSPGTTAPWAKARARALQRAGHTCELCGRTDAEARAAGTWLEVHHEDGQGVRATEHDQAKLTVLCRQPCHVQTFRQTYRKGAP